MASGEGKTNFEELLKVAIDMNAADLHINVNEPPLLRIGGDLEEASEGGEKCDEEFVGEIVNDILSEEQKRKYQESHRIDMSYDFGDFHFRVNLAQARGKPYLTARVIPAKIRELKDIGFPGKEIGFMNDIGLEIAGLERGLVLVTGVTGSGKSTTLASLIQQINRTSKSNIITIEDPIEYIHPRILSSIKQRELYRDINSFAEGVEDAMRQDPDIILIQEIRDYKTAAAALLAAETGHLVFSTLHTKEAKTSISRYVDLFPVDDKDRVRAALADNLAFIVCQQLVPYGKAENRSVAMEILKNTIAVRNLIRTDQTQQIPTQIQRGFKEGMILMDQHLEFLCANRRISAEVAVKYAMDRPEMISTLTRKGLYR
jgi:twitching motility protein PilT